MKFSRPSVSMIMKRTPSRLSTWKVIRIFRDYSRIETDILAVEDEIEDIYQEINIMSQLQSKYITKYFGSYIKNSTIWIVLEYCEGGSCLDIVAIY